MFSSRMNEFTGRNSLRLNWQKAMDIKNSLLGFVILGLAATSQAAPVADPASRSIEDISACMRVNVFDRGAVRDFQIKTADREGKSKTLKFKVFWKPDKNSDNVRITLQVIQPENVAGTAYLLIREAEEEQLYLYLPALDKVRRVVGGEISQKLWGSDLAFADIKQVQGLLLEGEVQKRADQQVSERPVHVLETTTNMEQTGYRLVRSYVDQESCMLLKAELFSDGKDPHKVLEADLSTLMEIDPWWVVLGYRMTDNRAGTHTELLLSDIYIEERLPKSLFTPDGFHINKD